MERIDSVNVERIEWCCADVGITPSELADEVGISQSGMSKIMSGNAGPTFPQLSNIAEFFERGVLFFLDSSPIDDSQAHSPQFRTLAQQKPDLSPRMKALISRVEHQRDVYLGLREEADEDGSPQFAPPNFTGIDIKNAAAVARKWLGLDEKIKTFDIYRNAVEARGLLVFRASGYNGKWQISKDNPILGFSIYDEFCPVIVVKKQTSDNQLTFTLMHELGHILLHKQSVIDDEESLHNSRQLEKEANLFAGNLLVPDHFLLKVSDTHRPRDVSGYDVWLAPIQRHLAVSVEVILRRLHDVGRLSTLQYNAYRSWKSGLPLPPPSRGSRDFRHREPKHLFGDGYVRTVLDALNSKQITLSKASDYLDRLNIKDIRKLESYYADA